MRAWYPWYPGDYLRDTQDLTLEENGAYRILLDHYYMTRRPIPVSRFAIAKILKVSPQKTTKILATLSRFFTVVSYENEECFQHDRVQAEIDKALELHEKLSEAGRRGGKARLQGEAVVRIKQDHNHNHNKDIPVAKATGVTLPENEDENFELVSAQRNDPIPFAKIVELFHEHLPTLPRVAKLTEKRKGQIRQRWQQDMPSLDQWENFFDHVSQSDFLMGRTSGSNGRAPFMANLEWITNQTNFINIAEGKYHRV